MINVHQYAWRLCMKLAFSIFFPKPLSFKKMIINIILGLFLSLFLSLYSFKSVLIDFSTHDLIVDTVITLINVQNKKG